MMLICFRCSSSAYNLILFPFNWIIFFTDIEVIIGKDVFLLLTDILMINLEVFYEKVPDFAPFSLISWLYYWVGSWELGVGSWVLLFILWQNHDSVYSSSFNRQICEERGLNFSLLYKVPYGNEDEYWWSHQELHTNIYCSYWKTFDSFFYFFLVWLIN